jgi:hypothetical protein
MVSPPTSKIRFLDSAGQHLDGPLEWATALIELALPVEEVGTASLMLQQREIPLRLERFFGPLRVLADWPLANPGSYELRARWSNGQEQRIVTITPRKITPASFEQMLVDLETSFPVSVAMALQRMGALAGIEILPPGESSLSQELTRLRRAVQGTESRAGLAAVLEDLAARPHQILRTHELWVVTDHARRPHPAHLKDALCRGYNRTSTGKLRTVLDTRVEHTVDVYENRLLRTFAFQVDQRMRVLSRAIYLKNPQSPLADELRRLSGRIRRARLQAAFLDGVSLPRQLPTHTTMVLLNRPSYRSAFQGFIEFHKSAAMRMDEPRLDAPLADVAFLYQLWGTMAVIQALLDVAVQLGYRVRTQQLVRKDLGGLCLRVLPDGIPAVVLVHPGGTVVKLIPERTYGSSGPLQSISFSQRPDIAIEIESRTGERTICIFDPKYKLNSEQTQASVDEGNEATSPGMPKKVDIDKMHSYRDAIRDTNLRRAVRYAAILYPGPEVRYADDIEALHAYPGEIGKLQSRVRDVLSAAVRSAM